MAFKAVVVGIVATSIFWVVVLSSAGAQTATAPATTQSNRIDQATVDAAMERLHERQREREKADVGDAQVSDKAFDAERPYSKQQVIRRKQLMLKAAEGVVRSRRRDLPKDEVTSDFRDGRAVAAGALRKMVADKTHLAALPLDRFRDLLIEMDKRNHDRLEAYGAKFGTFDGAASSTGALLVGAGVVEKAEYQSEGDSSGNIRAATYRFEFERKSGHIRRNRGTIHFIQASDDDLWIPVAADIDGSSEPLKLFDACEPLIPHHIAFVDGKPLVTQKLD